MSSSPSSSSRRPPPPPGGPGPPCPGPQVQLLETMASSQNLPAVLNDPRRGKQKDFFTRSWGDAFTESAAVPPSTRVCEISPRSFDKYLRKLRRYQQRRHQQQQHSQEEPQPGDSRRPTEAAKSSPTKISSSVSGVFLDPNFDLTKPETFAAIFPLSQDRNFAQQVETTGRVVQEKLSHQLDSVEVSIAHQVAQKSHHFFQVMTYHDALMTQLKTLVKIVRTLRARLKAVDEEAIKPSLDLCRLKRRLQHATQVVDKLSLMSFLHQTQPTIQLLLTSSEFSGALDLITTSCEIMDVDLKGVASFRHLTSQLQEIKSGIGKMLLSDFKTFIETEVNKEIVHVKATSLNGNFDPWDDFDGDQLKSVILGLLRQNSFTFLEALEDASVKAIKNAMSEVVINLTSSSPPQSASTNLTSLVGEFACSASSELWIDLFDVLTGSLLVLLHRVCLIHGVIGEAIESANKLDLEQQAEQQPPQLLVPEAQLNTLLATNRELLINVCDQMHERCAKLLAQRSRPACASLIKTQELTSLGLLVAIFSEETLKRSGKQCTGLQLSLQSQTVLFVQTFHEESRQRLSKYLDEEVWKRSSRDITSILNRVAAIPSIGQLFRQPEDTAGSPAPEHETNGIVANGLSPSRPSPSPPRSMKTAFPICGELYAFTECIPSFLLMLVDYCNLCSMLPTVSIELGLKTAELVKFFNSRICQLVLGAGAINVAGLKTITIRNLALALKDIQLITRVIPYVLLHFQECHSGTKAEGKQLEVLHRQFDQACKHLKNHSDELYRKILTVVEGYMTPHMSSWQPPAQLPSANFRALCKQLSKLHDSTTDVWSDDQVRQLFMDVHKRFLEMARARVRQDQLLRFDSLGGRALQSELTFYGQSVLRLGVVPAELLAPDALEGVVWAEGPKRDLNVFSHCDSSSSSSSETK